MLVSWSMRGGNPQHTGQMSVQGIATKPNVYWQFVTGAESSPAIASNGDIVVGTRNGIVRLAPDGRVVWNKDLGFDQTYATPAIAPDGTIYAAAMFHSNSGTYRIVALTPQGDVKWNYVPPGGSVRTLSSPVIDGEGTVYFANANSGIVALRPDGTVKWSVANPSRYYIGSPALSADGTRLYVGPDSSSFQALNTANGQVVWNAAQGSASSPAVGADGTIYLGTAFTGPSAGSFIALNPDGSTKWEFRAGSSFNEFFASPAIAPDGTIVAGSKEGILYGFNPDGSVRWSRNEINVIQSPSIDADGNVYLNSASGLKSFDIVDGSVHWELPLGGSAVGQTIMGTDGSLYFMGAGTTLYAVPEPGALPLALVGVILRRRRQC
jgi:outer membrane protein assembly factor BamB